MGILLADFLTRIEVAPICASGSSRLIGARAAPPKRWQRRPTLVAPIKAAGYLGMTVEMLLERYGHHHPDHLSGARKSFSKHREAVAGQR